MSISNHSTMLHEEMCTFIDLDYHLFTVPFVISHLISILHIQKGKKQKQNYTYKRRS